MTGGAGFIGCNLIKRLIAEGVSHIRVLDNLSVGAREDLNRVCAFNEVTTEDLRETTTSSLLTPHSFPCSSATFATLQRAFVPQRRWT